MVTNLAYANIFIQLIYKLMSTCTYLMYTPVNFIDIVEGRPFPVSLFLINVLLLSDVIN